jgi:hypothetical protein
MITPCQADPVSYDLDPEHGAPHPPVEQLVHACLTRCHLYNWCSQQPRDRVYGVVAGEHRQPPFTVTDWDARLCDLETRTATYRVVEHVARLARNAEPGAILPTQVEIADACGVTRVTVRSALRRLADLGLVEIHGNGRAHTTHTPDTATAVTAA